MLSETAITYHHYRSIELFLRSYDKMLGRYPSNTIATLLLTFDPHGGVAWDPKKANKRFRSFAKVLRELFHDYDKVMVPMANGMVHFHITGALRPFIGTFKKLAGRVKARIKTFNGFGIGGLEQVEDIIAWRRYLTRNLMAPDVRRDSRWKGVKLWTATKGIRVPWTTALHSKAFRNAMDDVKKSLGVVTDKEMKTKLGRYWAIYILNRKWKATLEKIAKRWKRLDEKKRREWQKTLTTIKDPVMKEVLSRFKV